MPYTRNFGMRSFENVVRAGRFRVPTTADATGNGQADGLFLIGTAVKIDAANPGFLTRPGDSEAPSPLCGVVVFEHIQRMGQDPFLTTAQDFETVPAGQYAQIMRGPGVKVWFKNTENKVSYDGRSTPGRTLIDGLGATPTIEVGDFLTVAADGTFKEGTSANGWFVVEQVDGDLVECRFTF